MNKKVLCTGTCGFIMSNFIRRAIYEKQPYSFVSIDRVSSNANAVYANKNHVFHIADLRDSHIIDKIFQFEQPDIVIHGAAESFVDYSLSDPNSFVTNNVLGTQVVINACLKHKVERLIYISTDEVYGQLTSESDPPWTEESPINPRNPYCLSPDTNILMSNGNWKKISEINDNADVIGFSFNNNITKVGNVSSVMSRTGEQLLSIKTEFGILKCSLEHTLFIKRLKRYRGGKLDNRRVSSCKSQEIQAKDLVCGDFLAFTRIDPEPSNVIKINPELSRFLGYFLGDGSLHHSGKRKNWYIRIGDEFKERVVFYSELVKSFTKKLFGREVSPYIYKHKTKNCWYLSFGCLPLVDIIKKLQFNNYAAEKVILPEIFSWTNQSIYQFLAGYFDADGTVNKDGRITASYSSASNNLLKNINLLLRRAGVLGHITECSVKEGDARDYRSWKINITDSKSLINFANNISSTKLFKVKSKPQKLLADNNLVWVRVNNIISSKTNEILYDLSVLETRNFIANGFVVHNSASKASGELLVKAAHQSHGLIYNITRSSNNYGPRQTSEKLIPKAIKCILNDQKIPIYGQGLQIRDWTHVYDNCAAILTVLNQGQPNQTYNISANQELPNIEVIQKICNAMGKGYSLISFVEERPGHDFRYSIDSSKIRTLGWKPSYKFKEGIISTTEWYQLNQWLLK